MVTYWLWGKNPYGRPENLNFVSSDQPTERFKEGVAERVYGSLERNIIDTKSGDDVIIGDVNVSGIREIELGAADILTGGPGSDWIYGGGGDDEIHGGPDLIGGWRFVANIPTTPAEAAFWDKLPPEDPRRAEYYEYDAKLLLRDRGDTIYGDHGNDKIWGDGGGDDKIWGGRGDDTIHGGPGNDWINGQSENDTIYGDEGADVIVGEAEDDTVFGGTENDLIYGSDGKDWLNGQQDNDTI